MEAPSLRRPELGPFPLCLDSGPPPGTNPQLWNLYKASQLGLIVPVGSEMASGPHEVYHSSPHPAREQSAFPNPISKAVVHIHYPAWLPLLLSQKPSSQNENLVSFLYGILVPGLGFPFLMIIRIQMPFFLNKGSGVILQAVGVWGGGRCELSVDLLGAKGIVCATSPV